MARPFYEKLDWGIILCTLLLAAISLATLYSATSSGGGETDRVFRQALWFALGFLLMAMVTSIDYHICGAFAYPVYLLVIVALAAVLAVGEVVQGSQRWIKVGPVSWQPSEMAKIGLILIAEPARAATLGIRPVL